MLLRLSSESRLLSADGRWDKAGSLLGEVKLVTFTGDLLAPYSTVDAEISSSEDTELISYRSGRGRIITSDSELRIMNEDGWLNPSIVGGAAHTMLHVINNQILEPGYIPIFGSLKPKFPWLDIMRESCRLQQYRVCETLFDLDRSSLHNILGRTLRDHLPEVSIKHVGWAIGGDNKKLSRLHIDTRDLLLQLLLRFGIEGFNRKANAHIEIRRTRSKALLGDLMGFIKSKNTTFDVLLKGWVKECHRAEMPSILVETDAKNICDGFFIICQK